MKDLNTMDYLMAIMDFMVKNKAQYAQKPIAIYILEYVVEDDDYGSNLSSMFRAKSQNR